MATSWWFAPQTYVPTVFENYTACLELEDQRVELSLWDTSGNWPSLLPLVLGAAFPERCTSGETPCTNHCRQRLAAAGWNEKKKINKNPPRWCWKVGRVIRDNARLTFEATRWTAKVKRGPIRHSCPSPGVSLFVCVPPETEQKWADYSSWFAFSDFCASYVHFDYACKRGSMCQCRSLWGCANRWPGFVLIFFFLNSGVCSTCLIPPTHPPTPPLMRPPNACAATPGHRWQTEPGALVCISMSVNNKSFI